MMAIDVDCPTKQDEVETDSDSGNIQAPSEKKKAKPWTSREMEEAEPYPLPEVPDGERPNE